MWGLNDTRQREPLCLRMKTVIQECTQRQIELIPMRKVRFKHITHRAEKKLAGNRELSPSILNKWVPSAPSNKLADFIFLTIMVFVRLHQSSVACIKRQHFFDIVNAS